MAQDQKMQTKDQKTNPNASTGKYVRQAGRHHSDDDSTYAVTIGVPVAEAFAFFRDFSNLPKFMKDIERIDVLSEKKSHWVAKTSKGDFTAEWDAEITKERKNEMISWKSLDGSEVQTSGTIWFRPAPETLGTVVSLSMDYKIPGGKLAELIAFFTGDHPAELAIVNLRRFKAVLETGEFATVEGQPSGRDADATVVQTH